MDKMTLISVIAASVAAAFAMGTFFWGMVTRSDQQEATMAALKKQTTISLGKYMLQPEMLKARCEADKWFREASDEDMRKLVREGFNPEAYDRPEMHGVWMVVEFFELVGALYENGEIDVLAAPVISDRFAHFYHRHLKKLIMFAKESGTEHWKNEAIKLESAARMSGISVAN